MPSLSVKLVAAAMDGTRCPQRVGKRMRLHRLIFAPLATPFAIVFRRSRSTSAAFFAGCFCFLRDLAVVFLLDPVWSRLFCNTETKSITLVGFGAFFGFSLISFPPAS